MRIFIGKKRGFKDLFARIMRRSNNSSKRKDSGTPNLTLYYPLVSSIISVIIRFMGAISNGIFLILLNISVFIASIVNINDMSIDPTMTIWVMVVWFVVIQTLIQHVINTYSHVDVVGHEKIRNYIKNYIKIFNKIFNKIYLECKNFIKFLLKKKWYKNKSE